MHMCCVVEKKIEYNKMEKEKEFYEMGEKNL